MITQTLKNWLKKLFAWWPWKRSTEVNYTQPVGGVQRSTAQESQWHTAADSTEPANPRPEGSSIAVEQEKKDHTTSELRRAANDQQPDPYSTTRSPATSNKLPPLPPAPVSKKEKSTFASSHLENKTAATDEQHLVFLYYLVKRGVFNEGFDKGQEPEQYKQK